MVIACHGQHGPCRVAPAHELFCIKAVPRGFSAQPEQEEDVVPSAHFATPLLSPRHKSSHREQWQHCGELLLAAQRVHCGEGSSQRACRGHKESKVVQLKVWFSNTLHKGRAGSGSHHLEGKSKR